MTLTQHHVGRQKADLNSPHVRMNGASSEQCRPALRNPFLDILEHFLCDVFVRQWRGYARGGQTGLSMLVGTPLVHPDISADRYSLLIPIPPAVSISTP